jgi:LuxR family maltose regulon positive regulatory protein
MQAEQGQLRSAASAYRRAIGTLSSQGEHPLPLSGHVYIGLASVLFEWNDLEGALENIQVGLQVGNQVKDIDALLNGYPLRARLLRALGKEDEAREAMQAGARVAEETQSLGCVQEARAWQALFRLAAGDVQEAQRWAAERGLESGCHVDPEQPLHEVEQYTYIRLLMATGKTLEALPVLETMIKLQERSGRGRTLIESLALQALCLRIVGRTDDAQHALAQALLLGEPESFKRVFIREGPPMAALLRSVGALGRSPEYIRQLLAAFGEASSAQETVLDPLSERELEVLQLVSEGLTNAEIAARLVIAQSTVKTHINRIYNKLGANSRTHAVARARQLQIIN